ncbi:hypothetical protein M413DRAFT_10246 [Hebeloma cylindrosporum]|uniref:Uncharacterized protein n=1 Tax=Hebeloma cylindrosporum TaxID=76867 RepID=A0A0C2YP22_HEBCY|nr:hypothetical protein M413DRAFT_10246 [Hebeloma cylindrosporum h7]
MSAITPSITTPTETSSTEVVGGLLTPLTDLDVPIPFINNNQLVDIDIPAASPVSEVTEVANLDNFFLASDLMACDARPEMKESLLFAESTDKLPRVKLPSITSVLRGLDSAQIKAIVDTTVLQLGESIQAAVRDAVTALKPSVRDTEMVDAPSVSAVSAAASVPAVDSTAVTPVAPMVTNEDGFLPTSYNFNFNNTYATIDHPHLRRTSYTIFKFDGPNSPNAQLYHAGQLLLFCSASTRIIDNNFRVLTMPADYLTFAHAFNNTAYATTKRFATYDPISGVPVVPADPIKITDFQLDQDLIRSLERTYPRTGFTFRADDNKGKKEVVFKAPLPMKVRKRADTPFPRSALRRQHITLPIAGSSTPRN